MPITGDRVKGYSMVDKLSAQHGDIAQAARIILRRCLKGALGTIDRACGSPHVSLVICATDPIGSPLFLLSQLALHTQNLTKSPQIGLLLDDTDGLDEPLTGGRLSLTGQIAACDDDICRRRFLNRHESAALYADFGDFSFYRMSIDHGHFVGGFGAIYDLSKNDLLPGPSGGAAIGTHEADIIEHMNSDHSDVVSLIAEKLNGSERGGWRLTGVDSEGCDLMSGFRSVRQNFTFPVNGPDDARRAFIDLAAMARKSA